MAAFFGALSERNIEHFRVVVGNAVVFRFDNAFLHCDAENRRKSRLGCRRLRCLFERIDPENPLGGYFSMTRDQDSVWPVASVCGLKSPGLGQFFAVQSEFFRLGDLPVIARPYPFGLCRVFLTGLRPPALNGGLRVCWWRNSRRI